MQSNDSKVLGWSKEDVLKHNSYRCIYKEKKLLTFRRLQVGNDLQQNILVSTANP